VVTKLDGTAKGGVLAAIAQERPIPVYFIGVGEKLEDLETFNAREFAQALLDFFAGVSLRSCSRAKRSR
jgi:fused signal recognition particle receptor